VVVLAMNLLGGGDADRTPEALRDGPPVETPSAAPTGEPEPATSRWVAPGGAQ
jgi:hypothetical protein